MRLDWALLANAAEGPANGLVYVLGAGIDTLVRDQFPAPFGGAMVLRLVTSRLESGRSHKVEVHCSDEDATAILVPPIVVTVPPRQVPADHPPGWDVAVNIVINLTGVHIDKPGFYQFEIMVDDGAGAHPSLPLGACRARQSHDAGLMLRVGNASATSVLPL